MTNSTPQLQIGVVTSEMFAENAYLVRLPEAETGLVVDPGLDTSRIIAAVEEAGWTPAAILNTHGHADHIAGNAALKHRWPDAPLLIGQGDADKLTDPERNLSAGYGAPLTSPPADRTVVDGEQLELAGLKLTVRDAPGHCAGHVVFIWEGEPTVVLGGDVLFAGGIGRTDFFDGSLEQLERSIRDVLYTLPDDTIVLPGHGPPTTTGHEKRFNPFVAG